MNVLYGVAGEGMGHATRSRVIAAHLVGRGHRVKLLVSGRAHDYLARFFQDVERIEGLELVTEGNEVRRTKTVLGFLEKLPFGGGWLGNLAVLERIHARFRADCVVSDFESLSYLYGQRHRLPVFSIDNMQVINRCELDVAIPAEDEVNFAIAKGVVKAKLPGCRHYLITSFFFPDARKERTSLFPPVLRDEVIARKARAARGGHVLVYQPSKTFDALVPALRQVDAPFVVYGAGRDEEHGNVTLRAFSEEGFLDDLASARAVITGGGFSLMSEAIYLGKPILSVPIRNQFEQVLNALYLEKLGYGTWVRAIAPEAVAAFVERADSYADALARHRQDGNALILAALDGLLAHV